MGEIRRAHGGRTINNRKNMYKGKESNKMIFFYILSQKNSSKNQFKIRKNFVCMVWHLLYYLKVDKSYEI